MTAAIWAIRCRRKSFSQNGSSSCPSNCSSESAGTTTGLRRRAHSRHLLRVMAQSQPRKLRAPSWWNWGSFCMRVTNTSWTMSAASSCRRPWPRTQE